MKLKSGQTVRLTQMSNDRYNLKITKAPRFDRSGRLTHHVFVGTALAIFGGSSLKDSFVTRGVSTYYECKKLLHERMNIV